MSSQKGNVKKQGPPKHQNKTAFKFDLHDTTPKTKLIKNLELNGICDKCKEVIDWKIKYKKYKPLTAPKKCTKCSKKAVKQAYYIMCVPCATHLKVCAKCGTGAELVSEPKLSESEMMSQKSQLKLELQMLSERKRRTYLRLQAQGRLDKEALARLEGDDFSDEFEDDDENDSDCSEGGE